MTTDANADARLNHEQELVAYHLRAIFGQYTQWLALMKFGLPTLLEDQPFLMRLIGEKIEAEGETDVLSRFLKITEDLRIRLSPADPPATERGE